MRSMSNLGLPRRKIAVNYGPARSQPARNRDRVGLLGEHKLSTGRVRVVLSELSRNRTPVSGLIDHQFARTLAAPPRILDRPRCETGCDGGQPGRVLAIVRDLTCRHRDPAPRDSERRPVHAQLPVEPSASRAGRVRTASGGGRYTRAHGARTRRGRLGPIVPRCRGAGLAEKSAHYVPLNQPTRQECDSVTRRFISVAGIGRARWKPCARAQCSPLRAST
jgi:hypothetical protein